MANENRSCKNVPDCQNCEHCNNCRNCTDCIRCEGCIDCTECLNCSNCVNCHGCVGLKNGKGIRMEPDREPAKPKYNDPADYDLSAAPAIVTAEELDTLIAIESVAFYATALVPIIKGIVDRVQGELVPALVRQYVAAGGNLANANRIVQIRVDQWLAEQLQAVDLPGPDAWVVPKIREVVVTLVAKKFAEFTAQPNFQDKEVNLENGSEVYGSDPTTGKPFVREQRIEGRTSEASWLTHLEEGYDRHTKAL